MPVYIVCTEGLICKIGYSQHPLRRIRTLQQYSPQRLELVQLIATPGESREPERFLHEHYKKKDKHLHDEWYQLTDQDLEDIVRKWPDISHELVDLRRLKSRPLIGLRDTVEDIWARHAQRIKEGYPNLYKEETC